jgi:hypothetical protein
MIVQALREDCMSCTHKSKLTETKNGKTGEGQVKRMLITFFEIKGTAHKELVLAGQTVNSAYYCVVLR